MLSLKSQLFFLVVYPIRYSISYDPKWLPRCWHEQYHLFLLVTHEISSTNVTSSMFLQCWHYKKFPTKLEVQWCHHPTIQPACNPKPTGLTTIFQGLMEDIPKNHLRCKRLVNNGRNYQPQLVITRVPSINSMRLQRLPPSSPLLPPVTVVQHPRCAKLRPVKDTRDC